MTMDEAIVDVINQRLNDADLLGIAPAIGSLQNDVNTVVSDYRSRAREVMFGKTIKDRDTGLVDYTLETEDGAPILYPGTAADIAKNQQKVNLYGR